MAKKKVESVVINDQELTPTTIGTLDTKEKSPILLFVILAIFLVVALFLPDINNYITNYMSEKNNNKEQVVNPNKDNEEENVPQEEENDSLYDYAENMEIKADLFGITNIVKKDDSITFNINNATDKELVLDDYKYFLEIYSSEKMLLQRIKISYGTYKANESKEFIYELNNDAKSNIAKIAVLKKTVDDYPEIELTLDDTNNGILTCVKDYETITYTFGNEYLTKISNIVNEPYSSDIAYTTDLQQYQVLAATLNNYEGVSSTLINNETGFTYTTLIDLRTANIVEIENNNFYEYRTLAKVVKFETESNGFTCN